MVSRGWPLLLIRLLPHVGDAAGSKSKPLADQISTLALACAGVWCGLAFWGVAAWDVWRAWIPVAQLAHVLAFGLLGSALAFGLMWRWFARRLQGFTGDCLGATQQVCELAFYLGLALAWR